MRPGHDTMSPPATSNCKYAKRMSVMEAFLSGPRAISVQMHGIVRAVRPACWDDSKLHKAAGGQKTRSRESTI